MKQKPSGRCPTKQGKAKSADYRPSLFLVLASLALLFALVRLAAGAPAQQLVFPAIGFVVCILLEVSLKGCGSA